MKSYFGYIRVSTPKQGRGVSLDEQRAAILAFAGRNGITIGQWFVETETAAKQGRAEYTKMIRGLEAGRAAGVVIHKIDRSARNMKDWANLGDLIDAGIDVKFAHESLDLHSRGGRLAADIQAVVAADYIRNLRDEVLKGFYGRLKQGVYPLPAPIGYLDRGAGVAKAVDPVAAPLVRYAFERYSAGDIALDALQQELAARGLRTRHGRPLSYNGLAGMLHNPFYIGLIRIERRAQLFEGAHVPLITKVLFDRVQEVMAGRHAPKAKHHAFLYRGMLCHQGCDRRLTGEIAKGRYVYYRCHGPSCGGAAVSEPILEAAIAQKILPIACSPEDMKDLRDLVDEHRAERRAEAARDETALHLRLKQSEERGRRLTDAYLDGDISKEAYDSRQAQLLSERRGLKDRLEALGGEPEWFARYKEFELQNSELLRYETLTPDEKRALVSALCSDFSVAGKTPVIALRIPYRDIAETSSVRSGGAYRGDLRTRAEKILKILQAADMPSNDNVRVVRKSRRPTISFTKSLKSSSPHRQPDDDARAA